MTPVARKPRYPFSLRKKLAFATVTLLLLAAPGWFLLEVVYRTVYSIPFVGGVVGDDDGRLPDNSGNRDFISRFRRSENPILFYEPRPGITSGIYSVNSAGFRDHEYSPAKHPSVFRIAMLGDSIVWGHGLQLQNTFAKQLESMLNEVSDQRFEVLNFGVSGYSTQQEVELYRVKARRYDPDLVIVGYCLNDVVDSSVEGEAFKRLYYDIFSKSYLYDHLKRVIAGVSYNQFGYMAETPPSQFDLREQLRLLESYCEDQRNLVVVFPILSDFSYYLYEVDHRRLHDAIRGLNYETLDLLDTYRGCDAESLIQDPRDRTHPNALGTRLAAKATLELLAEKQLVPLERDSIKTSALDVARDGPIATHAIIDARSDASYHVSKGRFAEAAEIAVKLSTFDVPDPVAELLRAFTWHLRAGDPDSAEEDLRRAIKLNANDPRVHRAMAQLLNSEGRRYESRRHALSLARLGTITPRELLSLIDLGSPFQLVSFDGVIDEPSLTLFDLGKARHQYVADGKPNVALQTLNSLVSIKPNNVAVEALRGRIIAEQMNDERFRSWLEQVPNRIDQHPEYWLAIGTWLSRNDRDEEAIRAFGEALRMDPTDRRSLRSLSASLNHIGESEKARMAEESLATLDKIYRLASTADAQQAMWIAAQLQSLTRPWESVGWYRHAFQLQDATDGRAGELDQRVAQIRAWENSEGTEQIRDARVMKMLGFDIHQFPMPKLGPNIAP